MQLVLSCLEQAEWDYETLLMKPYEGTGDDHDGGAVASDYMDPTNHNAAVMS